MISFEAGVVRVTQDELTIHVLHEPGMGPHTLGHLMAKLIPVTWLIAQAALLKRTFTNESLQGIVFTLEVLKES